MAEKKEIKIEKTEREYVIPLREKCRPVPRYKKTNKAVKTIKEFLAKHMTIRDRDLNKIKLDVYLNEFLWHRGIKHPPHKVKIKAIKEGDIVKVELADMPKKLELKKARAEKLEKKASESMDKKKKSPKTEEKPEEKTEEDKKTESEKKASVAEAGKELEKAAAKQVKHASKKPAQSKVSQRQNLAR